MPFLFAEAPRPGVGDIRVSMRRIFGILPILTGFLFFAGGARAQISPGPLSKARESLNGSTQCNTCHQFGTSTPTFKCLECHKEIADRLTAHKGYHASLGMKNPNGRDCVRCHLEHNGEDFSLVHWEPSLKQFDHRLAGYPLVEKHAAVACEKCHTPAGKDTVYKVKFAACTDCHQDAHDKQFAAAPYRNRCEDCHVDERWAPSTNGSGHSIYRENSAYDYQFQVSSASGTLKFNETRETRNQAYRDPARTLLVTTGFASLLLVAHPMYEASYVFEPAGDETIGGVSYTKIHFSPVPGATSPASLRLRGKNYPLPMSGTLWIEPQSGAIVKLEANVDSGVSDLGLKSMRSEVHYALHTFHNPAESVWIAESATIEVETPRQHWRNLHRFSDYKRFNVNVHEEMGKLP